MQAAAESAAESATHAASGAESAATSVMEEVCATYRLGQKRRRNAGPALLEQLLAQELKAIEAIPASSWPRFHPLHVLAPKTRADNPLLVAALSHYGSKEATIQALAPLLAAHGLELRNGKLRKWHVVAADCVATATAAQRDTSAVWRMLQQVRANRRAALDAVLAALHAPDKYKSVVETLFRRSVQRRRHATLIPPGITAADMPPDGPHLHWIKRKAAAALGCRWEPSSAGPNAPFRLYVTWGPPQQPWGREDQDEGRLEVLLAPHCACQRAHPPLRLPMDDSYSDSVASSSSSSSSSSSDNGAAVAHVKVQPPCPVCAAPWAMETAADGPDAAQIQALARSMGVATPDAARQLARAAVQAAQQWHMARRCAAARAVRRWQLESANIARLEATVATLEERTALDVPEDLKTAAAALTALDWAALWRAWGLTGITYGNASNSAADRRYLIPDYQPLSFLDPEEKDPAGCLRLKVALHQHYQACQDHAQAACCAWLAQPRVREILLEAAEAGARGIRFLPPANTPPSPTAFEKRVLVDTWRAAARSVLGHTNDDQYIGVYFEKTGSERQDDRQPRRAPDERAHVGRAALILTWSSGAPLPPPLEGGIKNVVWHEPLPATTHMWHIGLAAENML